MARPAARHRHQTPTFFHSQTSVKIGLVGGSFNPAHDGHIHVAREARRQLKLDQIWWLVSPQNPLKSTDDMAPLARRLADARKIAAPHPFLRVLAPELDLPQNYTINTLKFLKKMLPRARLVWIMGADNLTQLTRWYRYQEMIRLLPIAVIDRPSYSLLAMATGQQLFKRRYRAAELRQALRQTAGKLSGWCFIAGPKHQASASAIRAKMSGIADLDNRD
jgi:nicotinate-nucleotide adenylyltransferase